MDYNMHAALRKLVNEQVENERDELEAAYFKFFDTPEMAFKKLGLYKLEMKEPSLTQIDEDSNSMTYRTTIEYRFILKTEEELLKDRADEIIRRNAPIGTCIVCETYVYVADPHEKTIHGLYHHDCMDGRQDYRSI